MERKGLWRLAGKVSRITLVAGIAATASAKATGAQTSYVWQEGDHKAQIELTSIGCGARIHDYQTGGTHVDYIAAGCNLPSGEFLESLAGYIEHDGIVGEIRTNNTIIHKTFVRTR
jgi:hypothetical protein